MTRTTATLCLIGLLAAGPGWSQSLAPEAQKALGAALLLWPRTALLGAATLLCARNGQPGSPS